LSFGAVDALLSAMQITLTIDETTTTEARAGLHQSETLDQITERLLRQYAGTGGDVELAAKKVKVELAVSRAFADASK
jgi:hypothetical protein